jgi:hypothetical protein
MRDALTASGRNGQAGGHRHCASDGHHYLGFTVDGTHVPSRSPRKPTLRRASLNRKPLRYIPGPYHRQPSSCRGPIAIPYQTIDRSRLGFSLVPIHRYTAPRRSSEPRQWLKAFLAWIRPGS